MRRFDKKDNIRKANLLVEQRYLQSKGLVNEMFSGDNYDFEARKHDYGINPEIEPKEFNQGVEKYKVEVIGKEAEKDGGSKHRWVYEIEANNPEEAEAKATDKFNENWRLSDIYLFSAKVISNPSDDDAVQGMGVRF